MSEQFSGFEPGLLGFLAELEANNNRGWFTENKHRYESLVREPARALIREMSGRLPAISPHFLADDRKVGGSLMRVHRDTRFGRDKTPYKTNVGIQFRHEAGKDVHAPGLYLHIDTETVFLGAGIWRPDGAALLAMRSKIDEEQPRWRGIVGAPGFCRHFTREGETLRNPPRGFARDHPLLDDLKRKDHIAIHHLDPAAISTEGFPDLVVERLAAAGAYVRFICEALQVRF